VEDVATWCSSRVEVCRGEEFWEPVGAELDGPVVLVDKPVVMLAKQDQII
jgi:hypothetical protein